MLQTLTKQQLIEQIKDVDDNAEIWIFHQDSPTAFLPALSVILPNQMEYSNNKNIRIGIS